MNPNATLATREPAQGHYPNPNMKNMGSAGNLRNGTRSLIPRKNRMTNEPRQNPGKKGTSIFAKIRDAFSSRPNPNLSQVRMNPARSGAGSSGQGPKSDIEILTNEPASAVGNGTSLGRMMSPKEKELFHRNLIENHKDHKVEWQPVFHETCTIRLPVEESEKKIAVPQDAIDEWIQDNSRVTKRNKNSIFVNRPTDKEQEGSEKQCSFDTGLTNSCTGNKKEEPYSKFKCYYNYYLVDDYLDALTELENKKKDHPATEEESNLYDDVDLNVRPILSTKERLESGVPYDPKGLLASR